jgi:Secretion system C-terminal sorting domain
MQKKITKINLILSLICTVACLNAQTVLWPSATDTNQIKASKFTGGPNGWVTKGISSTSPNGVDSTLWVWDINNINLKKGSFFNTRTIVGKTASAADGYMVFNSDYLDNRGNYNPATMTGLGTGQSVSPHSGELISPLMDLTGANNFKLSFNQYLREYDSQHFVTWSEDGGTTWKTPIEVNDKVAQLDENNTTQVIRLPGSIGTNKFRVKFIFDGDYYFWCVDDIKIVNINKDMQVNSFFVLPTNRFTPKTQIDPVFFQADISNAGSKKATNVKLRTNIYNSTGTNIFTTEKNIGTLNPGDTAQNQTTLLPKLWTPNKPGNYTGSYRIYQDSIDEVPFNDSITFAYGVSDSTFSKENGATGGIRPGTAVGSKIEWKFGNAYHISNPGWFRLSATTGFVQDASGFKTKNVGIWVYKFKGDINKDQLVNVDERVRVATGELILPATISGNGIYNTALPNESDDQIKCVKLDTGTYLLMVEFNSQSTVNAEEALFVSTNGSYDYGATRFIADSVLNITRLHQIISGTTTKDNWSTGFFTGGPTSPLIRLNVRPSLPPANGCAFVPDATENLLTDDNKMSIFPNPVATNEISVSIDVTKLAKNAALEIYDITGKYMSGMKLNNVKNNKYTMNINDISNGSYFVKLTTEEGHKTVQFSVQK